MWIPYNDPSIQLTGRWGICDNSAVTTAPGSALAAGFRGELAVLHFDTFYNVFPLPHLWLRVDAGPWIEAPLDRYLRVRAEEDGPHRLEMVVKSAMEMQQRWYQPLSGKVSFRGMEAEEAVPLPPDDRRIIEFVGDSITEGVLVDESYRIAAATWPEEQHNRPCQDDAAATYAWLTAKALGMRPVIMGYGAVGVTKGGCGGVVAAPDAYPFCFDAVPYSGRADVVVVNHGTNDRGCDPADYKRAYRRLLDAIHKQNPWALLVLLVPFCGAFAAELKELADSYRAETGAAVHCIDTAGWLPLEPIHPGREGHRIAARHLIPLIRRLLDEGRNT